MIASVAFRNFKALRATQVALTPFNLLIGPNGSGKTSLIQALLRLRSLARLPTGARGDGDRTPDSAEIVFRFDPPHDGLEVTLSCVSDTLCNTLEVAPLPRGEGAHDWPALRQRVLTIREFLFDHYAMAAPAPRASAASGLATNGGNLAAVLAARAAEHPAAFAALRADFVQWLPEYTDVVLTPAGEGHVALELELAGGDGRVPADAVSQGSLYALALLVLAHDPAPPAVLCIEEIDRGLHPRLLREARDALYRLSHPQSAGIDRPATQVIATSHSPYFLDLFRDHPEEIIIAQKEGRAATFSRLSDRADLADLLQEGSLGDMWFAGILGGVPGTPEEPTAS